MISQGYEGDPFPLRHNTYTADFTFQKYLDGKFYRPVDLRSLKKEKNLLILV